MLLSPALVLVSVCPLLHNRSRCSVTYNFFLYRSRWHQPQVQANLGHGQGYGALANAQLSQGRGDTSAHQYPHPQFQADLGHGRGHGALVNTQQSQGQYPSMPPGGYQAQYAPPPGGAYNQYPGSQYQNNPFNPFDPAVAAMNPQQPNQFPPASGSPSGQYYDPRYMQQHPNASSSTGSMFVPLGPPPGSTSTPSSSTGYSQQPPQASPFPPPGYWKT
ncbi:hypothetical protein B0H12DRAFT_1154232 [Mycena haematopus]|nr:hypothetical protein B0H12DRAFT_1154232 [Mycena haematopus]